MADPIYKARTEAVCHLPATETKPDPLAEYRASPGHVPHSRPRPRAGCESGDGIQWQPKTQVEQLHDRLDVKFDQIALLIAQRLRFQTPLSNADRKKASEEAEQAIERWDKDAKMAASPPEPASTATVPPGTSFPAVSRALIRLRDIVRFNRIETVAQI